MATAKRLFHSFLSHKTAPPPESPSHHHLHATYAWLHLSLSTASKLDGSGLTLWHMNGETFSHQQDDSKENFLHDIQPPRPSIHLRTIQRIKDEAFDLDTATRGLDQRNMLPPSRGLRQPAGL